MAVSLNFCAASLYSTGLGIDTNNMQITLLHLQNRLKDVKIIEYTKGIKVKKWI